MERTLTRYELLVTLPDSICNLQSAILDLQSPVEHPMKRFCILVLALLVVLVAGVRTPAWAWWPAGHAILSKAAVKALPAEVPAFFREGGAMIGHCAWDPDVEKNRATPQ